MSESRVRGYVIEPLRDFLRTEASGGIVLLVAMVVALVWANSPVSASYFELWDQHLRIGPLDESLHDWVNDALMAIFFFVVGLEIKREFVVGELREARKAALPLLSAMGGMVGPALVYLAFNAGTPLVRGWGIPVATDIAFAVGVLTVLGRRAPSGLKIFLLTLAIADDIGGIGIIAIFYTEEVSLAWLGMTLAGLAVMVIMRWTGVVRPLWYVPVGVFIWFAAFESGVHPTIAGVAIGLITPAHPVKGRPVLEELEHRLHPVSSFAVIPIFALANAGVSLGTDAVGEALGSEVFQGVALGLLVGKTVGISLAAALAVKLGIGRLSSGLRPRHIVGAAALAGIGFTVALFITNLAFGGGEATDAAKVGVLVGSFVSALVGVAILTPGGIENDEVPSTPSAAAPERD